MKECVVCKTIIADDAYVCPVCGGGTFSFSADDTESYDAALKILRDQDKSSRHVDRSVEYANAGDFEKAIAEIKIALKMCPNNPTANGNMGGFLLAQGKARAAIPWLQKALELDPNINGVPEAMAIAKAEMKEANKHIRLAPKTNDTETGSQKNKPKVRGRHFIAKENTAPIEISIQSEKATHKSHLSRLAVVSLILSTPLFFILFVVAYVKNITCGEPWLFTSLPGGALAIIALFIIKRSKGKLAGTRIAILSIVMFVISSVLLFFMAQISIGDNIQKARMSMCQHHFMYPLYEKLIEHINNNENIITEAIVETVMSQHENINCPLDFRKYSYAVNRNIINKNLSKLPPDIVFLFEVKKEEKGVSSRYEVAFPHVLKDMLPNFEYGHEISVNGRFQKNKYSFGTISYVIKSLQSEDVPGCNVIFLDGKSEFVPLNHINEISWDYLEFVDIDSKKGEQSHNDERMERGKHNEVLTEGLYSTISNLQEALQRTNAELDNLRKQNIKDQKEIKQITAELYEKIVQIQTLEAERRRLISEKIALEEQFNFSDRKAKSIHAETADRSPVTSPDIKGLITHIDGQLIQLSVGSGDGVKENMVFHVTRGDLYICDIVITYAEANQSVGVMQLVQQTPQVGDKVSTRL